MKYWRVLLFLVGFSLSPASAQVVINEIHYDPAVKTELIEFIELYNAGASTVPLDGWRIAGGVEFAFPPGSSISGGGYLVIGQEPAVLKARYGIEAFGPWKGNLANEGEEIVLRDQSGTAIDTVTYKLGFPWPTVGDAPGYSIELVNPSFDNDLGGNWRASVRGGVGIPANTLISQKSQWSFWKGTAEPSNPIGAWRQIDFDDAGWSTGAAPIGYDSSIPMGTELNDMRGNYTSVYLRRKFQVADAGAVGSLKIEALYDDGIQVWINGQRVVNAGMPNRDVLHDELSTGAARESDAYDEFLVNSPGAFLRSGENIIAVQLHNVSLSGSSDCFVDLKLTAQLGSSNAGPTPGARNAVYDTNAPPAIRQVAHTPIQPRSGEAVRVTAKITDPDGISAVRLLYQVVEPGNYIELNDAAYETNWQGMDMTADPVAGESVYAVTLPASLQTHRRLIRYRIIATDGADRTVRAPYEDDPQPNFAYFVYDGVPGWGGAIQPGSSDATRRQVQNFSAGEMGRLPAYHLISKRGSVEDATWNSRYGGDLYRWWGTLVYDGKVYDHIRYRARGGVWRYAMGKNMWKFDLNRGHEFQARDNYGREYKTTWKKVNLGANIQQGDYLHRGEQGMFESVGFALFNLAGVEAPKTHWINFRVIDEPAEAGPTQYSGDYWGLYLAIEQEDGRFLDEHDLPDGNLYKMEGGTGELNNQGRTAATDKSDLNSFQNTYRNSTPSEQWWRENFDLEKYYSYHTIVHGIHHYDICDGKNYFYYLNPDTGRWSVHTWDLDLTWANNMYRDCDGDDPFRTRVVQRAPFDTEFRNRAREIRDLLFNTDQAWKLIDEYAGIVKGTNAGPNILAADRAMWDYNPVMADFSVVNGSKAGQGLFYRFPYESSRNPERQESFDAAVAIMKDYVVERSAFLDERADDPLIPAQPTISYVGPAGFPSDQIRLRSSQYAGGSSFGAMKWRVGEVREAQPGISGIYEIQAVWESAELSTFAESISVPAEVLRVGHQYRARVRMKDSTGRWSHWSEPMEFTAGEPGGSTALQQYLRPTEIMYNPAEGGEWEFVELRNISSNVTLQLAGVAFTAGIEFVFPGQAVMGPGEYVLVVNTDSPEAFRSHYNLDPSIKLFGPYSGSLDNAGERLTLKTAMAGAQIFSLVYDDAAPWPVAADGQGYSLVPRDERVDAVELGAPENWRVSHAVKGSPGRADSADIDSDGDGLPDEWEARFGLNALDPADGLMDLDNDGVPNRDEFIAGSDPTDPASLLKLGVVERGVGIALDFVAHPERTFIIQFRDALGSSEWQELKVVAGASGSVSVEDSAPIARERYYRVVAKLP